MSSRSLVLSRSLVPKAGVDAVSVVGVPGGVRSMGAVRETLMTHQYQAFYQADTVSVNTHKKKSLFQNIPPERIGISGEYDHNGLAKRVRLALSQAVGTKPIAELGVRQRGRVVILHGKLSSRHLLTRIVQIALEADGAADVELRGVLIEEESQV